MSGQEAGERVRGEKYGGQSREARAADRCERLVRAGLELFAARAFDDVTVAEVCARAKVSKRYFYEHFTDREELLLAVHRQQNDWLLAGMAAAAPQRPADLEALLRPMMTTLVHMLAGHPDSARVIYINAPRMELRRRGLLRKDAELFGRLIRRTLPEPPDALRHNRELLGLVAGVTEVLIDWLERDMADDADVLADHLTGFALALLTGSE
ncbi:MULTISPECIES: TetR/AcrR family transcriptional regulator [unclassified Streptomyces]|uniref:TetR/AcrR family transcriptional regulator n=1 Tax=unclassified Streptomyces TaxID=2593676 RepID=UPI002DDBFDD9|nr:TetR/AcrR family transcriptional regulator [Streptomyces sp. NBC_01257]WRZ69682.1 TetR/AcrR family transcriptional regulator [Streptomyces sp. NBC_01257]